MRGRLATFLQPTLLLALACLCLAAAPAREALAQEQPAADQPDPLEGTTRKLDEYGKIGHCDETARLDNLAIELQNRPGTTAYLMIYVGKDDLPSWEKGILKRSAYYLVNSRGIDAGRVKVIDGGYREHRTTELWIAPEGGPAPQPSDTVEFKLDRTKAYQWDEDTFDITFNADDPVETEGEEAEEEGEAESEAAAGDAKAVDEPTPEDEATASWRKEVEKYELSVVARGVIENEPEEESPGAGVDGDDGEDAAAGEDAASGAEPEGPPTVGEIKISLWWNVEALAEELKGVPDARLCLVFYWGVQNATQERVKELVEQALVKTEQQLGIKRERIITIDGGRSLDPGMELWVMPPGAGPPKPRPGQKRNFGFYSMPGEE